MSGIRKYRLAERIGAEWPAVAKEFGVYDDVYGGVVPMPAPSLFVSAVISAALKEPNDAIAAAILETVPGSAVGRTKDGGVFLGNASQAVGEAWKSVAEKLGVLAEAEKEAERARGVGDLTALVCAKAVISAYLKKAYDRIADAIKKHAPDAEIERTPHGGVKYGKLTEAVFPVWRAVAKELGVLNDAEMMAPYVQKDVELAGDTIDRALAQGGTLEDLERVVNKILPQVTAE